MDTVATSPTSPVTPADQMGDLISRGVTLLFTSNTGDQILAEALAAKHELTCCASRWMGQNSAIHNFSHLKAPDHPNRIIIVKVPEMTHGVKLEADRVVWVGSTGAEGSDLRKVFTQCMARGKDRYTMSKMARPYVFESVPTDD